MLELYQLEQLLVIAGAGTLSAAAEKLHLSQPAISRSMQRLERELQVPLFVRRKNRIELNENGLMAVEYARKILDQADSMVIGLREYDRRRHTISIGSCAPAPLWSLLPSMSYAYPQMTIASDIRDNDVLIRGLGSGTYQLIVLPFKTELEGALCVKYFEEHLFFSLPPSHPKAGSKGLYFRDLNGEAMLLRPQLGFWARLHREMMPDTRFLVQQDSAAFYELVRASALPSFTSDVVIRRDGPVPGRVIVPILDPEANAMFHLYYRACDRELLSHFLRTLSRGANPLN